MGKLILTRQLFILHGERNRLTIEPQSNSTEGSASGNDQIAFAVLGKTYLMGIFAVRALILEIPERA